jgi:hypothetical protein
MGGHERIDLAARKKACSWERACIHEQEDEECQRNDTCLATNGRERRAVDRHIETQAGDVEDRNHKTVGWLLGTVVKKKKGGPIGDQDTKTPDFSFFIVVGRFSYYASILRLRRATGRARGCA